MAYMKLLFLTIALLYMGVVGLGQNRVATIDSLLMALHQAKKLNGNVLIAEKGEVIYSRSFGIANEATQQPLNELSIFELASCSKQFTAMAILMLHEKGKLQLDDPMARFIPELAFYQGVTIRHLLHHTSGLPDYMELMERSFDKSTIATNEDIIALFSKTQPPPVFAPNTQYEYSNTGYALLASIIQKASGLSYKEYLQQQIFTPLHMTHSFVHTRRYAPRQVANYAYGYLYDAASNKYLLPDSVAETRMVIWLDGIVGDGCVNATVVDLLKWDRALYTNQLLTKSGMQHLFEVATLNNQSKTQYGMGWAIEDHAIFGKIVSHSGGWPGYVTYIERHISNDKTIIILQNHQNVTIPAKSIRQALYKLPLPVEKTRKEITLPADKLQKLVGTYEIDKALAVNITLQNNQLFAQLTGQQALPLFAESELFFFLKVVDAQIEFTKNEQGEIVKLTIFQNGNTLAATRLK